MSKTENTFDPVRCIFKVGGGACSNRKHQNRNKGKCVCAEEFCPKIEVVRVDASAPSAVELTDEIRSFRQKNKEFEATNDHETYLVVVFSCKEDRKEFLKCVKMDGHTLIDGYELAGNLNLNPSRPSVKLADPLG